MNRFSPLHLQKFQLKNRVVVPPMASGLADYRGRVTEPQVEHYANLSSSGAGLIFVEYSFVAENGRSEENQLGISDDEQIEGLQSIAEAIHGRGARAAIQLSHGGGKSSRALAGPRLITPSGIQVPVKGGELETPDKATDDEIADLVRDFAKAALRAEQAGFDVIELHSAHGYGLNQWLSPITNHRAERRMQMLLAILREIRRKTQLAVSVRMPGQDFISGGLTIADTILVAQELEAAEVDLLHVSSGIGGWRRPETRTGEGYLVAEAAQIQASVGIPVIGVGGIETGEYIDRGLQTHQFALAAVGRAILKDPNGWRERQM